MEKGQLVELIIEDMSNEGHGIGKTEDGFVVFVPGAVVGDKVRAKLTKVKKNYSFSTLEERIETSAYRNDAFDCRICGGCPYGVLGYDKQLEIKANQVRNKLERLAGVAFEDSDREEAASYQPIFRPIVGMRPEDNDGDGPYRYRNKAVMAISQEGGDLRIGFRKAKSHEIADCDDCILQPWTAAAAAQATREFMREFKMPIKGMTVKTAFGTGQVMVVYDVYDRTSVQKVEAKAERLVDLLDAAIYNLGSYDDGEPAFTLESISLRYEKSSSRNGQKGSRERGKMEMVTLAGSDTIVDELVLSNSSDSGERRLDDSDVVSMKFEISPESFYQVNTAQMQRLYGIVREYCRKSISRCTDETAKPVILDLYCGVGTIGLCVADLAERVVGIEVVKDAVIDANRNAVINGIVNAVYVCGKAEEEIDRVLPGLSEDASETAACSTMAILDPPRAGCSPKLLEAIAKAGGDGVDSIVYVSCDPAALGRDLKILIGHGYALVEATPVDMFPHTGHVETVVLLSHKDPDSHIHVKVEFGEGKGKVPLDKIAERAEKYKPKEKVTYKKIKEYIEDKFGFKVHTAYIAEVKRAYGLPMYDAPNAVEELKQPRKHPTEEKVKAISDALVHFGLIDKQQATTLEIAHLSAV